MNHRVLEDAYRATEEDLLYGVGVLALPGQEPAPFIHIHYCDWSREKLEVVRESFRAGLVLVFSDRQNGIHDLHISTRERVAIQAQQDGHTSELRAPAWDAHLEGIDEQVVRRFEADRRRLACCRVRRRAVPDRRAAPAAERHDARHHKSQPAHVHGPFRAPRIQVHSL